MRPADDPDIIGRQPHEPDLQWEPWAPHEVATRLRAVTAPWCVAGGWALDLCRGEQTRRHEDLEVAVPAAAFGQVHDALAGCGFEVAGDGKLWPMDGPAFAAMHQTWVSEVIPGPPPRRVYRLDVFREPSRDGEWVCRRDAAIQLPYERVIRRDRAGIPYLAPEIVLLFKAKATRPKDEADFHGMLPLLAPAQRDWLRRMLDRLHPGHPWTGAL
jgi:hypothetical protein